MIVKFVLNGELVSPDVDPSRRLIDILREDFFLTGAKEGCGEGECGSCTVLMDGLPVHSCLVLAGQLEGHEVLTVEGLAQNGELDLLQNAFVENNADALAGKTIVPFATSGGSGMGDSTKNIQSLAPKAKVVEGKRFRASVSADDLRKWAAGI